jgi:hypothetical protein
MTQRVRRSASPPDAPRHFAPHCVKSAPERGTSGDAARQVPGIARLFEVRTALRTEQMSSESKFLNDFAGLRPVVRTALRTSNNRAKS